MPTDQEEDIDNLEAPPGEPDTLDRWNWGAFWLVWLWSRKNNVPLVGAKMLIPFYAVSKSFELGRTGNKLAWENGSWESVDHFNRTQRNWAIAGFSFPAAMLVLALSMFFSIQRLIVNSEAFNLTLSALEKSERFGQQVGYPVETRLINGRLSTSLTAGSASLDFRAIGPNGESNVYSSSSMRSGNWSIDCIRIRYESATDAEFIGECPKWIIESEF